MRIVVRPDLTAILTKEIGPKSGLVVVEKLAGTTPKSAIMFLLAYPNIRYRVFNLADSSAVYFERAEELCPEFGIDFGWFRDRVEYSAGVNLFRTKLSEALGEERVDAIVYWGAAMKCLEPFRGDGEEKYLERFKIETARFGKDHEGRHRAMREFHRQHTQAGLTIDELFGILADDINCLKEGGRIITNFKKDFTRIRRLMAGLGMCSSNYKFSYPNFLKDFEKAVTVWKRK